MSEQPRRMSIPRRSNGWHGIFADKLPEYAMVVDLLAVKSLLAGGGCELRLSDADSAVRHTITVAASISATDWAHEQIDLALQQPRVTAREIFHASATAELKRNVSCVTA